MIEFNENEPFISFLIKNNLNALHLYKYGETNVYIDLDCLSFFDMGDIVYFFNGSWVDLNKEIGRIFIDNIPGITMYSFDIIINFTKKYIDIKQRVTSQSCERKSFILVDHTIKGSTMYTSY